MRNKIANKGYDELAASTTRTTSRHGLTKAMRKLKRQRNRIAARVERKIHFGDFEMS